MKGNLGLGIWGWAQSIERLLCKQEDPGWDLQGSINWTRWSMPVIPALERWKLENEGFKVTLPHILSQSQHDVHQTLSWWGSEASIYKRTHMV